MKIREILKNETVQTIILMAIIIASVAAFWSGLRFALRTDYPLLAVASGSMEPVLYKGDLIMVQGISNFEEINAGPPPVGDILVFDGAAIGKPNELIVHRAVDKKYAQGVWYFKTWGDNNPGPDSPEPVVKETDIVGRYVGKVPWLGHVPLFMREVIFPFLSTPVGFVTVVLVILGLILLDYIPLRKERAEAQ